MYLQLEILWNYNFIFPIQARIVKLSTKFPLRNVAYFLLQTSPSSVIVTKAEDDVTTSDLQPLVVSPPGFKKRLSCYVPWWGMIIAWVLCLLSIIAATVFTVFYGIQFGNEIMKKWFTSIAVSFCTGVLLTQPLQVIIYCNVRGSNPSVDMCHIRYCFGIITLS